MTQKNQSLQEKVLRIEKEYEELNYHSYPFAYTRPDYVKAVAGLFEVKAPSLENARILELGCASGGNIVNFAMNYPNSYSLGVDLSKPQIEIGLALIEKLELKNIELKHMSIADLDESYGKFDYIICHGVLSWVPEEIQDKILETSKKLLTPNGVALVSYNTYPGWKMIDTIRDMMLFHSSMFPDVKDKLQQSKLFLKFVNESLANANTPYAQYLKEEAKALEKHDDFYIRHEYLADNNYPIYFHQFMAMANKHGLNYLAESNFQLMYTGNLPSQTAEKLSTVQDIIRTEQYMDFINNRRFRITLLCHDDVKLKRNIDINVVKDLYMTCNLTTDKKLAETDINNTVEQISFYNPLSNNKDNVVTSASPIVKAIFYTFMENIGNFLKPKELLELANEKIPSISVKDMEKEFNSFILRLIFSGYIKIFGDKPKSVYKISANPKVTNLVKHQLSNIENNKFLVTNQINETVSLSPHEVHILPSLDGEHTIEDLEKIILEKLKSGELVASSEQKTINEEDKLKLIAKASVAQTLEKLRTYHLLVG